MANKKLKLNMILMAAGNSRRFGGNKLLADFESEKGRKIPLYRHTVEAVKTAARELEKSQNEIEVSCNIVIVTQYEEILKQAPELRIEAIENVQPELGLSHTIKLGIEYCIENKEQVMEFEEEMEADMFFVCDQPYLRSESICKLVYGYLKTEKSLGCLEYEGRLGNPCIFNKKYRGRLLELKGDVGGKKVVLEEKNVSFTVKCNEKRELKDIDFCKDIEKRK